MRVAIRPVEASTGADSSPRGFRRNLKSRRAARASAGRNGNILCQALKSLIWLNAARAYVGRVSQITGRHSRDVLWHSVYRQRSSNGSNNEHIPRHRHADHTSPPRRASMARSSTHLINAGVERRLWHAG